MRQCSKCLLEKDESEMRAGKSECRTCASARERRNYAQNPYAIEITKYKNYRHKDRTRGFLKTLSKDEALNLMSLPCHWCETVKRRRGLDRIDNMIGHSLDNVVPCCEICNDIRRDRSYTVMSYLKHGLVQAELDGAFDLYVPIYKQAYFQNRHRVHSD